MHTKEYTYPLFGEYTFEIVSPETFAPFFSENRSRVFTENINFRLSDMLDEKEMNDYNTLKKNLSGILTLNIFIRHAGEIIGWHTGRQTSPDQYQMNNTALFTEHHRKGIYTAFLKALLDLLRNEGFQHVISYHHPSNNNVIIPKLKCGFIITGMKLTDDFGTLVELSFFYSEKRKKLIGFRSGYKRPDEEIKNILDL